VELGELLDEGEPDADAAEDLFSRWLLRYTREEIMQLAAEHGLMIFPVLNVPDNLTSKQLESRGYWQKVRHEDIGATVTYPGPPVRMSGTPWAMKCRAPGLGEHNAEVYGALGVSQSDLADLQTRGIV